MPKYVVEIWPIVGKNEGLTGTTTQLLKGGLVLACALNSE